MLSRSLAQKGRIMTADNEAKLSPQELAERFDLLVADAREYAVFLFGPEGKVLCWNPGAQRIFGYQSTEIVGEHFSRFFSPEDIRNGQPEHEVKTALDQGHADSVRWQLRKDGSRFWCKATLTPLFDENKQVRSFVRVMHDLTDGEAQEAQRKRSESLAEANRSKEEFMALLSHELRNPLGPILNALDIQRQNKTQDPILRQAGDIIERQVKQMVRLVDDLLDISRITKGKLRFEKEPVELRVVVNRAAESARLLMNARKHDFSISLPMEPLWIEADPTRLEQIVVNLLNNAAKYTNPGGFIRLTVGQEETDAVVSVQDNGLGISAEMLPSIFNLFTQVDSTLGRSHGGLGIGLALVATLVELHNGRITAHSAGLGRGSEFTVRLPMLPEDARPAAAAPPPVTNAVTHGLRVLLVEDNIDAGDCLSLLLRMNGHDVLIARSGPVALGVAPTFKPQVVLMDIGLPGMDGYQVAQRLRERPEFKHVIMCALSGYTPSEADLKLPKQSGFDHHFVKPVRLATLLEVLATVKA
jgi:PAS domain S-box-containing protein